jgi:hypothetical protein
MAVKLSGYLLVRPWCNAVRGMLGAIRTNRSHLGLMCMIEAKPIHAFDRAAY